MLTKLIYGTIANTTKFSMSCFKGLEKNNTRIHMEPQKTTNSSGKSKAGAVRIPTLTLHYRAW